MAISTTEITLSERAARRISQIIKGEAEGSMLRVSVKGGGCSGFSYGFVFDDQVAEDDTIVSTEGVSLVVDAMSQQYLLGARVDYEEGLEGSRFVIHNPNAQSTCGCGSSFSV